MIKYQGIEFSTSRELFEYQKLQETTTYCLPAATIGPRGQKPVKQKRPTRRPRMVHNSYGPAISALRVGMVSEGRPLQEVVTAVGEAMRRDGRKYRRSQLVNTIKTEQSMLRQYGDLGGGSMSDAARLKRLSAKAPR